MRFRLEKDAKQHAVVPLFRQLLLLVLTTAVAIRCRGGDIRSDISDGDGTEIIGYQLNEEAENKAEALAAFAALFMHLPPEQARAALVRSIKHDPKAKVPLQVALLFMKKGDKEARKKFFPQLQKIAHSHPEALALNLAVIAYLLQNDQKDAAERLAVRSINTVTAPEKLPDKAAGIYLRLVTIATLLQAGDKNFQFGEELFERLLSYPKFRHSFTCLYAAVNFMHQAALHGSNQPFLWLFPSEREQFEDKLNRLLPLLEDSTVNTAEVIVTARFYAKLKRIGDAERILLDRLLTEPDNEEILATLANILEKDNDSRALLYWRKLAKCHPDKLAYLRREGEAAWRLGYLSEAARAFRNCLKLDKKNPVIPLQLAMVYLKKGDYTTALQLLNKEPKSFYLHHTVGLIKMAQGDCRGALAELQKAEKLLPPKSLSTMFCLNMLQVADCLKREDIIIKYSGIILNNAPEKMADYGNAVGYTLAKYAMELKLAEHLVAAALQKHPHNSAILDSMAWVKFQQKDYLAAQKYIEQSLQYGGKYPHAVIAAHAGDIYAALGNMTKAAHYWRLALRIYSKELDRKAVEAKLQACAKHAESSSPSTRTANR